MNDTATESFINSKILVFMTNIVSPIFWLLIAFAVVVFVYGIWEYYFKDSEGSDRAKGSQHILWGVVGFAIILSSIGIITVILNTFIGEQRASTEFNLEYTKRESIKNITPGLFK